MKKGNKHHLIPKFILKNFSNEGKIFIYNKNINSICNSGIQKNNFVISAFYDDNLEKKLSILECDFSRVVCKIKTNKEINFVDKIILNFFLCSYNIRVEYFKEVINKKYGCNEKNIQRECLNFILEKYLFCRKYNFCLLVIDTIILEIYKEINLHKNIILNTEKVVKINHILRTKTEILRFLMCETIIINTDYKFILPETVNIVDINGDFNLLFFPLDKKVCVINWWKKHEKTFNEIKSFLLLNNKLFLSFIVDIIELNIGKNYSIKMIDNEYKLVNCINYISLLNTSKIISDEKEYLDFLIGANK